MPFQKISKIYIFPKKSQFRLKNLNFVSELSLCMGHKCKNYFYDDLERFYMQTNMGIISAIAYKNDFCAIWFDEIYFLKLWIPINRCIRVYTDVNRYVSSVVVLSGASPLSLLFWSATCLGVSTCPSMGSIRVHKGPWKVMAIKSEWTDCRVLFNSD